MYDLIDMLLDWTSLMLALMFAVGSTIIVAFLVIMAICVASGKTDIQKNTSGCNCSQQTACNKVPELTICRPKRP